MRVEWYGQSAFHLSEGEEASVAIDPFGDLSGLTSRGMQFDYVCHFGDFGQSGLREEQAAAIGAVDLLFLPVGGGPTIGAEQAAAIVERLSPRWVVPMHYRTARIGFLETADAFLERSGHIERLPGAAFDTAELPVADAPLVVVPAAP